MRRAVGAAESFDHIVVGGGSAGCVAAARLAGEAGARVLLLEAGHSHRHPLLDMPPGIFKMFYGSKYMRYHRTVPQEHLGGRVHDVPQGNVLGGGSSVNAQVYMRGRPSDYDGWDEVLRGNSDRVGWGWKDVLPHFVRMEGNNRLSGPLHGTEGPLLVSDPIHVDGYSRWFVQSLQELGVPYNHDFNGPGQRGCGFYQFTNRDGKRCSAAHAYVEPMRGDGRLTVRLRSEAARIIVERGRAVGVEYRDGRGAAEARACGEVIVAAGALVTPKLLMLSGIGPEEHLRERGIEAVLPSPGVGRNLMDHPEVPIASYANGPYGYYRQTDGWRMVRNGIQYKMFGTGPVTSAGFEAGAFVNPGDPEGVPTIQGFCVPFVYLDRDAKAELRQDYGMTVTTVLVKPRSRGEVRLASADPADMPLVSPNLLSDEADMAGMVAGQRLFLRAFEAGPLAARTERVAIPDPKATDEELKAHCRRFVKTNFHPAGTARMGADGDEEAVLDARMRVRGIEGLRVCDMSAAPVINAGNTNAPAMMLGDRCADLVMGRL